MKLALLFTLCAFAAPLLARFIKSADGTQLWAEAKGDPTKPHVVFIHGYLLGAIVWDKIFEDETYSNSLYLVRYDMRGFGQSDKPLDQSAYESARFAEDFDAVVQKFNLNKPVAAAWSYGASVFVDIYALHGNGVVSGIVYLAGLPYTSILPSIVTAELTTLLPEITQDTNVTLYDSAEVEFLNTLVYNQTVLDFRTRTSWLGLAGFMPQVVKNNLAARTQDPSRLFSVGGPVLPVLFVAGAQDGVANDTLLVQTLQPKFQKFQLLWLPESGHTVWLEEFEEVRARVLTFVNSIVGGGKQ
ncbi:hypothetical protein BOTBODRAFT_137566 [Botryobasidium botryosum FD-172 SS1]|uniref:AB hydrolase-1 domain-containing protein n=1 Tax=Botryobasidium botryosum (strain FD-172 SS1) TaxID=930990 RepID=A0A067M4F8_BOTB1|nr:hypothetical protein BOTBODRAFT_137566 [Botryobasidium botryosum FD-172 SS1]